MHYKGKEEKIRYKFNPNPFAPFEFPALKGNICVTMSAFFFVILYQKYLKQLIFTSDKVCYVLKGEKYTFKVLICRTIEIYILFLIKCLGFHLCCRYAKPADFCDFFFFFCLLTQLCLAGCACSLQCRFRPVQTAGQTQDLEAELALLEQFV